MKILPSNLSFNEAFMKNFAEVHDNAVSITQANT